MASVGTLTKWGNGQGVRVPKSMCEKLGARVGDPVSMDFGPGNTIVVSFGIPKYQRHRKVSIEELFDGYVGDYRPTDPWGHDAGAEVVE